VSVFRKFVMLYLVALACCAAWPSALMAKIADIPEAVAFKLEAVKSGADDEIIVSVWVQHVPDVYAYEVELGYEPRKLELIDTLSGFPGMSVNPILSNDRIRFAHTQIGNIPGKSGDLKLATFIFKQLHKGDSTIRLRNVSLVASDLKTTDYKPGNHLRVEDTSVHIRLTDIAGHWAEQAIEKAVSLGFVEGYADDTFRPERKVTRGEFVSLLSRALQLELPIDAERPYADDSQFPLWAKPHIYAAADQGLIFAYEDHTFRADRPITRVEMTAIMARAFEGKSATAELEYKDADQIPAWGYEAVAKATASGLVQGKPGRRFAPNEQTTRAEAVALILNVLNAIDKGR
jgi:hypothetical protein